MACLSSLCPCALSLPEASLLFAVFAASAWVLLSVRLLDLPALNFTADAKWAIGIIAVVVHVFATLQFMEWRKM